MTNMGHTVIWVHHTVHCPQVQRTVLRWDSLSSEFSTLSSKFSDCVLSSTHHASQNIHVTNLIRILFHESTNLSIYSRTYVKRDTIHIGVYTTRTFLFLLSLFVYVALCIVSVVRRWKRLNVIIMHWKRVNVIYIRYSQHMKWNYIRYVIFVFTRFQVKTYDFIILWNTRFHEYVNVN